LSIIAWRFIFVVTLTPFVPLSLKGEGEDIKKRGYRPS